uniref:Uncharacterized protein n=1 Tax=Timema cristinae TaxID=61476 RepID=A0A7R9D8C6_TIMCR|nr:unnamed protein product [Timema cristinae]
MSGIKPVASETRERPTSNPPRGSGRNGRRMSIAGPLTSQDISQAADRTKKDTMAAFKLHKDDTVETVNHMTYTIQNVGGPFNKSPQGIQREKTNDTIKVADKAGNVGSAQDEIVAGSLYIPTMDKTVDKLLETSNETLHKQDQVGRLDHQTPDRAGNVVHPTLDRFSNVSHNVPKKTSNTAHHIQFSNNETAHGPTRSSNPGKNQDKDKR